MKKNTLLAAMLLMACSIANAQTWLNVKTANGKYHHFEVNESLELTWGEKMEKEEPAPGEAIDLGLPSGTLWASCNVGASTPEEFGSYFAWGETEEKDSFYWSNYKWCNGSEESLTKYCSLSKFGTPDYKYMLDPEDDVAHLKWGGDWRIPSEDELYELFNHCEFKRFRQKGTNGYKVIGPNGNFIFLPDAGSYWQSEYNKLDHGYWTSSLFIDDPTLVSFLNFDSHEVYKYSFASRVYGLPIRPVQGGNLISQALELSAESITMQVNDKTAILISYGRGNYIIESSDSAVAIASLSGNSLVVKALKAGTTTITLSDISTQQSASVAITVLSKESEGYEYVNLGLPSGTLWATCNIGANSPEEVGGYYAYGETEEKEIYDWDHYKWYDATTHTITKYCTQSEYGTVDGRTVLDPEDDVAHVKWGGNWRMPTQYEYLELITRCVNEWVTQNGVDGLRVTGPNGNSIFFPAANRHPSDANEERINNCYSSADVGTFYTITYIQFIFNNSEAYMGNECFRYIGCPVRPVIIK